MLSAMPTTVILLAGPSGSGKSRLARVTGAAQLRLDDFYLDEEHPDLPRREGRIDWDDAATWDAEAALRALQQLAATGRAIVPEYSISQSRRTGTHTVDLGGCPVVIAEGIFAVDLLAHCQTAALPVVPVWLDRPRNLNFSRRLRRDLKQHRKPPAVLVRRGMMLWRDEPALRARARALGFEPRSMHRAEAMVRELMVRELMVQELMVRAVTAR